MSDEQLQDIAQQPRIEHYGDGVIVRGPHGYMQKGSKTPKPITSENAHTFALARKQKAAAALRQNILAETQSIADVRLDGSAEAVGYAGGLLWAQIVLNNEAYDRDRIEAFNRLSVHAEVLADKQEAAPQVIRHEYSMDADTAAMLMELRDRQRTLTLNPTDDGVIDSPDNTAAAQQHMDATQHSTDAQTE